MSYKVEVNAGGMWLPATPKYFRDKHQADGFRQRFEKFNQVPCRIKEVGKSRTRQNPFMWMYCNVLMYFYFVAAVAYTAVA